jgi:hypothetical protein
LADFPAESRAIICPPLDVVIRCEAGATTRAKEFGTIRSHRIHFCWFTYELRCPSAILPVVRLPLKNLNYVFAMYTVHLATGHNLWCQSLRLATINNYLLHAAQLVLYFDPEARDPRKDEHGQFAVCLQKVHHEIKRWEDIPKKWEPYTAPTMHMLLAAKVANQPRDGLLNVLLDWFTVMLAAGAAAVNGHSPSTKPLSPRPHSMNAAIPKPFVLAIFNF